MDDFQVEKLIVKRLSGEISSKENDFLEKWLKNSENNKKLFLFHKAVWNETATDYKNINLDRAYDRISQEIDVSTNVSNPFVSWSWRRSAVSVYVRAASVILIVMLGLITWRTFLKNDPPLKQSTTRAIEKEVAKGQKLKAFLPDGSVAWLNAESKIRYDEFFSDSFREVYLEGMAYFDVERDSLRPFIVRSGGVDVTALGTTFTVRFYDSEDMVSIALEEGSVMVKLKDNKNLLRKILLEPGKGISYNLRDQTYVESPVVADDAFNWRNGVLYFENASLDQVVKKLTRWYGVEFEVLDRSREQWHYTATFRNFYLKDVLQSLAYTKNIKYEIRPDKVIIYN